MKKTEESVKMRKNKEKVLLSMALVLLMTVSIFFYALYIRQQIYYEGTRAMLETYEQVNKTLHAGQPDFHPVCPAQLECPRGLGRLLEGDGRPRDGYPEEGL